MHNVAGRLELGMVAGMLLLGAGCGDPGDDGAPDAEFVEAPTRAERDSAVAESRLPGASGVGAALDAAAAASARAQAHDTIR